MRQHWEDKAEVAVPGRWKRSQPWMMEDGMLWRVWAGAVRPGRAGLWENGKRCGAGRRGVCSKALIG